MPNVTITRQVINQVNKELGLSLTSFVDKLKTGERSVKVWGWKEKDYDRAIQLLKDRNCKVKKVVYPKNRVLRWVTTLSPSYGKDQIRLHVIEP